MEQLLELVQVEQNIYNIVFHELIRQASVSCSERGQLLAKLRFAANTLVLIVLKTMTKYECSSNCYSCSI